MYLFAGVHFFERSFSVCKLKMSKRVFLISLLPIWLGLLSACEPQPRVHLTSAEIESIGILASQANKKSAINQLERWANDGLPVAQRELALAYASRTERRAQAVQWLQKAATAGDAQAQFELAKALHEGKMGFAQDWAQAWKWFELAAKQGDGKASFMLARMAAHGQGLPRDPELSVKWLQEGSRQRNAQAMYQLSVAYANGDGIPRNMMQARYWLNMSAEHDYNVAVQALAMELDGLGGQDSPFAERSRQLFKEASDHRLMRWNTHL
jgi:uncharacterized protein